MALTIMGQTANLEVLKQPRGLLRLFEFFFAMLAFSFCAGFGSNLSFDIKCSNGDNTTAEQQSVVSYYSYPFQLDHMDPVKVQVCGQETEVSFPGDFSSDAQFFVFIGVICWLYSLLSLLVYTFLTDAYEETNKNLPIIDLVMAVIIAFFWLASSSAWGHGLSQLKNVGDPENWIYQDVEDAPAAICRKNAEDKYVEQIIESCSTTFAGNFAGGNVSVLLGFLNVFLWSANTWFLYKETRMHNPNRGNLQNVESPTGSI
jgi:hypothetical protein